MTPTANSERYNEEHLFRRTGRWPYTNIYDTRGKVAFGCKNSHAKYCTSEGRYYGIRS
jgi:hypothetical protein